MYITLLPGPTCILIVVHYTYVICISYCSLSFFLNSSLGIVNDHRRTALEEAAHDGKQDVVKYLHSVDVNSEL